MTKEVLEYCARAVVQYLDGDLRTFYKYSSNATDMYKKLKFAESCSYPIKEVVPEDVRKKLYKIVS